MLSPKAGLGRWVLGRAQRALSLGPRSFWWLLVAFALAILTPSPAAGSREAPGCPRWGQRRDKDPIPRKPPKAARPRWQRELFPLQGETPGAAPAVSAGEQRLCATSERSKRRNPARRRRILHQPKAYGGAKPFAAAGEPPTPPAPLPPKISRFFSEFPEFPERCKLWGPTAPLALGTGGHREAAGQGDAPDRDTPANSLPLQECEQEQSGNQTVWGQ